MKSLSKILMLTLLGAMLTLSVTGCGKPSVEDKPPVVDAPRPDTVPGKPNPTTERPDVH